MLQWIFVGEDMKKYANVEHHRKKLNKALSEILTAEGMLDIDIEYLSKNKPIPLLDCIGDVGQIKRHVERHCLQHDLKKISAKVEFEVGCGGNKCYKFSDIHIYAVYDKNVYGFDEHDIHHKIPVKDIGMKDKLEILQLIMEYRDV